MKANKKRPQTGPKKRHPIETQLLGMASILYAVYFTSPQAIVTTKRPTTATILNTQQKYLSLFDMGRSEGTTYMQYNILTWLSLDQRKKYIMSASSGKAISQSRQSTSHIRRRKLFGCEVTVQYSVCALCRGYFRNIDRYQNSWG